MEPFSTFLDLLGKIEDPRRAEGKLYRLPHVILFAILVSIAGANSYRSVHTFIRVHLPRLRKLFRLKWRRAPAYTTIRGILLQLDPAGVECVFRLGTFAPCFVGPDCLAGERFGCPYGQETGRRNAPRIG
jgi:hypothetical protein